MVFERIHKGAHIMAHPPMVISITKSGFSLGSAIAEKFKDFSCAEIYLDRDNKRVGLKPTNDIFRGFKLSKGGKSVGLSATRAANRLPAGKYKARFEDDMVVIDVAEIAEKSN